MPSLPTHCRRLLVLAAIACLMSTACRESEDVLVGGAVEQATAKRDAGRDGDRDTPARGAGQRGGSLPLPDDFPADVYLPESYVLHSVMDIDGVRVFSLRTPARLAELFAAARRQMVAQGWKETMAMQHASDSALLVFEKPGRSTTLSFNDGGDAVTLGLQLQSRLP